MDLAGVMDELGLALETIEGLRVFPYTADRITPPAAMVGWPDPVTYGLTYGRGMDRQSMPVWLMVSRADARSASKDLAPYLDGSGPKSVRAAIEDATTYEICHAITVKSATVQSFSIAGVEYLGAEFIVDIAGSGS